jgi:hypothetical protein
MGFLNPILLFGAAAIAVPIAIHLLNKRQYEKVTWAAMRFLMASIEQNQRRLRIEDLLLLLLRCALLVLLALALARPALPGGGAGGLFGRSGVTAVLVLDNSYSMGLSDGVTTRFDNAKKALEQVIDSLPVNSAAAVFLAGDGVERAIGEPTFDLNLARKTIREAPLSDRAGNVVPALRAAIETLSGKPCGARCSWRPTVRRPAGASSTRRRGRWPTRRTRSPRTCCWWAPRATRTSASPTCGWPRACRSSTARCGSRRK